MKKISKGIFLSVAGGIVLVLQMFGLKIDAPYVNEIIEAVCAVLVVLGIVTTTAGGESGDKDDVQKTDNAETIDGEEETEENKDETEDIL